MIHEDSVGRLGCFRFRTKILWLILGCSAQAVPKWEEPALNFGSLGVDGRLRHEFKDNESLEDVPERSVVSWVAVKVGPADYDGLRGPSRSRLESARDPQGREAVQLTNELLAEDSSAMGKEPDGQVLLIGEAA